MKDVLRFLEQSNAIEGVYDADSLLQAWYAWEHVSDNKRYPMLSTGLVLKAHKILMLHQRISPLHKGYWRNCDVSVAGRLGASYYDVPDAMQRWVNTFLDCSSADDIKKAHIEFEIIHPFVDGNGRVGRLVMNWHRRHIGLPILIIEEQAKQNYYAWFR